MSKQQELIADIQKAIERIEKSIISKIQIQIKDYELIVSSDCNLANETAEIISDINIDYDPACDILDIDEKHCICKIKLECNVYFKVKLKGYDYNTASYDEDDIHFTENVNIDVDVDRTIPVIIKAHYRRNANNHLYIDTYNILIEPIIIERNDYDEDFPRYK